MTGEERTQPALVSDRHDAVSENSVPDGVYHPDPIIDAEIAADALAAERADLAAGYAPRRWTCPSCGASHGRGHFQVVGVHRCLGCGYVGAGGVMRTLGAADRPTARQMVSGERS